MTNSSEAQTYWGQILQSYFKAQLANERYIRRIGWCLLFGLIAYSFFLLGNRPQRLSFDKAYLALGIVWLGFLPSIQYLFDRDRPPIPFFPLVGLFYANGFGLPMFSAKQADLSNPLSLGNVSDEALFLVLLGVLGMNAAFYISKYSLLQKTAPIQFLTNYSPRKLISVLAALLLLHIASLFIPFVQRIPSAAHLLGPIGLIAYGMFYIMWARGQLSSTSIKVFVGICFALEAIKRLASGALAEVAVLCVFMILIMWYERKRIPITLISILVLFFLAFNPIKGEYRRLTWYGGPYSESSPIEKAQLFVDVAIKHYSGTGNTSQKNVTFDPTSGITRTTQINLFSRVFEDTPKRVPYWGGETYSNIYTSFIPRIIWPDKPKGTIGNQFGRRYRYLGKNDYSTSYNLPWIVEMYANFGRLGVLMGMPLVGLLLAFLDRKLNSPKMESMQVAIGATILSSLFYQESNFALMVGNVIPLVLALYLIFKYLLGNKSQQTRKYDN
jgi:hypothetical protein